MLRLFLSFLLATSGCGSAFGQQIIQVRWPTTQAAPPVALNQGAREWLPAFRLALTSLPEASIVALCLSQPQMLGLAQEDGQVLQKLTTDQYALMGRDALFQGVPSALPYCFSESRPAGGLATVYVPASATTGTPSIVFLHGYGGSFHWYLHVLKEAFPNHLILCPAYGISCGAVPPEYVRGAVEAVERKLSFRLSLPTLVGLSAGGFGACALYTDNPGQWSQMVCLAAHGREPAISRVSKRMRLKFMAGADEFFVKDGSFVRGVLRARSRGADVDSLLLPACGHFFLLQKRDESIATLRRWLGD